MSARLAILTVVPSTLRGWRSGLGGVAAGVGPGPPALGGLVPGDPRVERYPGRWLQGAVVSVVVACAEVLPAAS